MCTLSKYVQNESRMVSPEDLKEIHPLLNTDEILGGLYVPADGSVDPTGIIIHLKIRQCAFIIIPSKPNLYAKQIFLQTF